MHEGYANPSVGDGLLEGILESLGIGVSPSILPGEILFDNLLDDKELELLRGAC